MASPGGLGRGRGRGRGALMFTDNRPGGDVKDKAQNPVDMVASLIRSLSIEPEEVELLPVSDAAKKFCTSKVEIETLVSLLYNRCLVDWKFSRCAALLCHRIMSIQVEKESLRTVLLHTIQTDFKVKDKLRSEEPERFLGCLSFLCQILATIRDANDKPFVPLIQPVLDSMELLLNNKAVTMEELKKKAADEEIRCASFHLVDICPVLHRYVQKDKKIHLLNVIKDLIVENSGSKESRYQLIFVVEKFATLKATEKPLT